MPTADDAIRAAIDPHFVAAVLTLRDGRVVREAIYIAEPWDPPEYRSRWVSG